MPPSVAESPESPSSQVALSPTTFDRLLFPATIFVSAFLLFWVQLILGKFILPWFGGAPAVWTTCMLFFQCLLLAGYLYAHAVSRYLSPRQQALTHSSLLLASVALLLFLGAKWISPITPGASWKPAGSADPILRIIALLLMAVGLPYFALSSTSPLLQAWHRQVRGASTYRLYAVSNAGSFLALFAFPLALEPALSLRHQSWVWSFAYLLFVAACLSCVFRAGALKREIPLQDAPGAIFAAETSGSTQDSVDLGRQTLWLGFSALASASFLATTNQLCQDVAVVPLLWVLPLGIYLLSFILCFEHPRWYRRNFFHLLFAAALCAACFLLFGGGQKLPLQIVLYLSVLFGACMVCHGELARMRPTPRYLTLFYLDVALGGALGSVFVALLGPRLFGGFWEYPLALWSVAALLALTLVGERKSWLYRTSAPAPALLLAVAALLPQAAMLAAANKLTLWDFLPAGIAAILLLYFFLNRGKSAPEKARSKAVALCAFATLLMFAGILGITIFSNSGHAVARFRNFYGTLAVVPREIRGLPGAGFSLVHGRVVHGFQFRSQPLDRVPTSYYASASGVGLALTQAAAAARASQRKLSVGAVGLGIGTVAAYARPGDSFRFYEINPAVISVAADPAYFTYLAHSLGNVQVIPGDARLSLERQANLGEFQNFDVLVLDAFSGDAVPAHLLTLEAFALYLRHLSRPQGILAIHITNRHLDLRPVVTAAAAYYHLKSEWIQSSGDGVIFVDSDWMLLSEGALPAGNGKSSFAYAVPAVPGFRAWTDDYSNLLGLLRR